MDSDNRRTSVLLGYIIMNRRDILLGALAIPTAVIAAKPEERIRLVKRLDYGEWQDPQRMKYLRHQDIFKYEDDETIYIVSGRPAKNSDGVWGVVAEEVDKEVNNYVNLRLPEGEVYRI